ncbi:type II secretion system protein [Sporolactobacillus terrae]|uniref:type II secretion system protein n=1 Tax=Sporolactobacillus terrae TaxID=269673 RepID=UPI0018CC7540|nr:type II secretion system protein [Sporolactobacillus terrae]
MNQVMPHKRTFQKRESGYALVIVLLVITVFSVLGLTVMSVSFNHTKQFSKETTQTQALNVAEMGLKAYNKELQSKLLDVSEVTQTNFKDKVIEILPGTLNSSSNLVINSMQGNPCYTVTHGEVGDSTDDKITVTITSRGTTNDGIQVIMQKITFEYRRVDTAATGDADHTPPYMGLSLPYISGGYHNGYLSWLPADYTPKWISEGDFVHQGDAYVNNNTVIISGRRPTTNDVVHQTVDLTTVKNQFKNMPLSYPANQPINGAASINEDAVMQAEYNGSVNFNSFNLKKSNPSVTIDGKAFLASSINSGNLDEGTIIFNDDVAINGDLNAGNKIHFLFKGNVYINGAINASDHTSMSFEKSLFINGSNINLNNDSTISVNGNLNVANGSLNGSSRSSALFNGNVYFNHDYNSSGSHHFYGYVFINGSFNNSGPLTFERTVYVRKDFYPKAKGYSVIFKNGIITAGNNASFETSGNGEIVINAQLRGGGESEDDHNDGNQSLISIIDTKTNYQ